ncbi:S8 family serine peptidase, partial [Mycobacteroides abscessus]|uniref:S8 family serine peptidase n=1 Tax=Mycobacteroides abscessus TaxID=36809 RepID=UPI0013FCFC47
VGAPGVSAFGLNGDQLYTGRMGNKGLFEPLNGTSFAAPYVTGLAALIRARYPELTATQVIRRITETAHAPAQIVDCPELGCLSEWPQEAGRAAQ